ncbi:MAG: RNA-protein complex protein Nop10 [Candidatus Thermoplasmatota archaeon]|nr:RNA-protein complex protein Nop10 [Candidatus Thermoplasmatota archaeon]
MRTLIRKCTACGSYTLREECHRCDGRTVMALPPRYSPEDRYGEYRRRLKRGV